MTTQKISLIAFLAITLLGFAQTSLSYKLNFINQTGVPMDVQVSYLPPCAGNEQGSGTNFTVQTNAPYTIHSGVCSVWQVLAATDPNVMNQHRRDDKGSFWYQPNGFQGPHIGDTDFVIGKSAITIQKKEKETKAQKKAAKQEKKVAKQEKKAAEKAVKAAKKAAKKNKK